MSQLDILQEEMSKVRVRLHDLANEMTEIKLNPVHHICLRDKDWGKLFEIVAAHANHVIEGDKTGGFRDRLLLAERDIKALKERFWQSSLIGGLIGALLGSGSSDAIRFLFNWLVKN